MFLIVFKNPLKAFFFTKNNTYYNLCRVCLYFNIHFLLEKQAFNELLNIIGKQNKFYYQSSMNK